MYALSLTSRVTVIVLLSSIAAPIASGHSASTADKRELSIVDLGTLPGRAHSSPADLNDLGEVVGFSYRATDPIDMRAFLWSRGRMIDLGTLGGYYSQAYAINNRGQVIGRSATADFRDHAFLWENGTMIDLSPDEYFFEATALNDQGQVVGTNYNVAFIWQDGNLTQLPGFTTDSSAQPFDINNRGQIAGVCDNRAVIWENGRITDLGVENGAALRINERGQVIGSYQNASGESQAFFWESGQVTEVGPLGEGTGWWPGSVAWGLNNRGQVAGFSDTATDATHAFFWDAGHIADIGLIPGATRSLGWAINNSGQVVGETHQGDMGFHGFLWIDGVLSDLGVLPGGAFSAARDINEKGDVLGEALTAAGEVRAVLWTKKSTQ